MHSEELWQVHLVSCLVVLKRFSFRVIFPANTGRVIVCFSFFLFRLPFSFLPHNIWARLGQATLKNHSIFWILYWG